jgi:hypothetical protein
MDGGHLYSKVTYGWLPACLSLRSCSCLVTHMGDIELWSVQTTTYTYQMATAEMILCLRLAYLRVLNSCSILLDCTLFHSSFEQRQMGSLERMTHGKRGLLLKTRMASILLGCILFHSFEQELEA